MKQPAQALSSRLGPLALIVLLHVGFFYALERGLAHKTVPMQTHPREVFATFVTPAPQPVPRAEPRVEPETPRPRAIPKASPVPQKPTLKPKVSETKAMPEPVSEKPTIPADAPKASAPIAAPPTPPTPPAPPAPPAPPKTVSGVEYLVQPDPQYPAMSRRMREEGTALVRVLVNEHGRVDRAELKKSTGSARLDEAAKQAALRTVLKPYTENGKALPVFAVIPITFQLD